MPAIEAVSARFDAIPSAARDKLSAPEEAPEPSNGAGESQDDPPPNFVDEYTCRRASAAPSEMLD